MTRLGRSDINEPRIQMTYSPSLDVRIRWLQGTSVPMQLVGPVRISGTSVLSRNHARRVCGVSLQEFSFLYPLVSIKIIY